MPTCSWTGTTPAAWMISIFDVDIRLNDTITYEGVLEPIR